jgi:hypothetical protein
MKSIARTLALAFAALSTAAQAEEPELPGWMAGCWEQRSGERWAEECWTAPRGGMMLGTGRAGVGEQVSSWETMRIARGETGTDGVPLPMAFVGAPSGLGWTVFAWSPSEGEGVEFANAAHDYPQRIRYWREGDKLRARISVLDGSRAVEWTYSPAAD